LAHPLHSRHETVTTVNMKSISIWDVTPCSLVEVYRLLELFTYSLTLQIKAMFFQNVCKISTRLHGVTSQEMVLKVCYFLMEVNYSYIHFNLIAA
jgi:hypothetical protein